jgi:Uma2 family endonuclease
MQSIIKDQTKPASEWIAGRVVQKVSPSQRHASAQARIVSALLAWSDEFDTGRVGTEWEFRIAPPGEKARTLVPDVAFLSYEKISLEKERAAQYPLTAPDAAFEVLSPRDRKSYVAEKIRVYLASGTSLVAIVNPDARTVILHDAGGMRMLKDGDTLKHESLPNFAMPVAAIFAKSGER